jgi:carboxyl-terminal processing protease
MVSCKSDHKHKSYLSIDSITINNLIKEVIEEINNNYADEITREKLEEGAINGMLAFLDEHSLYINQEEFSAFNQYARGTYLGMGIEVKQTKDGIEIVSIIDESPAFTAGLRNGDIITHIGEKEVGNIPVRDMYLKLNSDASPEMLLSVTRNKNEKFNVVVKKLVIQLQTVKVNYIQNIATIKVTYFNEESVSSLKKIIKNINQKKNINGVIIDLRNNPGGILDQAIGVADLFLGDSTKIVDFKSRNVDETRSIYAKGKDILSGVPMAILIDRNSASGAELVAAALGENKRAIILGEKSYGKGSLQTIFPIPGKGAIKLTTAFFYTPNGNKINNNGITPDIAINDGEEIMTRAIDLLLGLSALDVPLVPSSNS